jgi:hypothetical protein
MCHALSPLPLSRLREKLVRRVLVGCIQPDLSNLPVADPVDRNRVVGKLLARPLTALGEQRDRMLV